MKNLQKAFFATLVIAALMAATTLSVFAAGQMTKEDGENKHTQFQADLSGFQQVPTLFSSGEGTFSARLNPDGTSLTYTLSYTGLVGAFAAHIHIGAEGTNGGVIVFLCGGGGKPECPSASGTVTGTITAADVKAVTTQGFPAGDFAALLTSLRAGATYVNVHTTAYPGGEIRGQVTSGEG